MATVYLARDVKHDRLVALKVLHPELAATLGPERFLREIRLTARLDHPHILPVHDSGEAQGLLWYTMPYVEGESLRERLRREGQLPVEEAVLLTREVAGALDCAHRHGVIHRDVKPENILLSEGHARVADFGVARALEAAGGGRLTETGLAVGTPAYMSPEQASAGQADARSDIYALGCVLYELLAGEPPYTGPTAQAVIAKRFSEPIPHLSTMRAVPPAVEVAVTRALAKAPADRFPTARDFAAALQTTTHDRTDSVPKPTVRGTRGRQVLIGTLGLLAAAWAYGLWRHSPRPREPAVAESPAPSPPSPSDSERASGPSVAVLPLTNLSPDRENEYFSDGMTEELITALSRIDGLRVAARTSAFAFKGTRADIREIGTKLRVGTVLEGSVRRAGKRLRVSAQLINVADGYHIWSEEYNRELGDVFAVQDELARAIVGALRVRLELPDRPAAVLVKAATADLEAHDLYLQGRFFWNQRTYESLRTAVRYFERAIARDSAYAEAYAALAEAYVLFPNYIVSAPGEAYPKAKAAAVRALALDSTLGHAHATLGQVRAYYEWDWRDAEEEFQRAIRFDPSYATAHSQYGEYLSSLGRHQEALAEADRAVTLDPLSRIISADKGADLIRSRRYDEAMVQLRATLEADPDFPPAHNYLGWAYLAKGMPAEAVAELETTVRLTGRRTGIGRLAWAYALSGQRDRALEIIRELTQRSRREYVAPFQLAVAYAGLGDKDRALAWLERGATMRDPAGILSLLADPLLDPLRSDARFTRLLTRMGLK
jgi:serine/threonine protein kinase/tetratricopeptide (TPR) repeat protein